MGTAYTAASVRGVTPTTKNYIFYSQRNGELGLRIMVTCLEVNQMLFCNIYIYKTTWCRNKVISEHISELNTQPNTTLCWKWNVTYFNLKISAIPGKILQKDMHSSALPEDAVILYWIIILLCD